MIYYYFNLYSKQPLKCGQVLGDKGERGWIMMEFYLDLCMKRLNRRNRRNYMDVQNVSEDFSQHLRHDNSYLSRSYLSCIPLLSLQS